MNLQPHHSPNPPPYALRTLANFDTTKLLLAALINEQLVSATLPTNPIANQLRMRSNHHLESPNGPKAAVTVSLSPQSSLNIRSKTLIECIHPEDLTLPVLLRRDFGTGTVLQKGQVSDPAMILDFLLPQSEDERLGWRVREELRLSAARQGLCCSPVLL